MLNTLGKKSQGPHEGNFQIEIYEHRGAERGKNKANKKEPNSNESVSHNFKTYEEKQTKKFSNQKRNN